MSQLRAQYQARAARQSETDQADDTPNSCAYYKWRQEAGEGDYVPSKWVHNGGGDGGFLWGGGGGEGEGEGGGWEDQACEYGGVSDGSADFDFEETWGA